MSKETTQNKTLMQLQREANTAKTELESVERKIQEKRYQLEEYYKSLVEKELEALFGKELKTAQAQNAKAYWAQREEEDRLAKLGVGAKFPLGTRFVQKNDAASSWANERKWEPTGKVGVYEIINADSQHPERNYVYPIGTQVIRLLDKSGKPGKRYIVIHGTLPYGWFTEDPALMPKDEE